MDQFASGKTIQKLRKFFSMRKDIVAVYLFGSKAENRTTFASDIDLAVLFEKYQQINPGREKLNLIYKLSKIIKDAEIDIHILEPGSNLPFIQQILKNGKVIIDNDPDKRSIFESIMYQKIFDFQPIVNSYVTAMNQRLKEGTYGHR